MLGLCQSRHSKHVSSAAFQTPVVMSELRCTWWWIEIRKQSTWLPVKPNWEQVKEVFLKVLIVLHTYISSQLDKVSVAVSSWHFIQPLFTLEDTHRFCIYENVRGLFQSLWKCLTWTCRQGRVLETSLCCIRSRGIYSRQVKANRLLPWRLNGCVPVWIVKYVCVLCRNSYYGADLCKWGRPGSTQSSSKQSGCKTLESVSGETLHAPTHHTTVWPKKQCSALSLFLCTGWNLKAYFHKRNASHPSPLLPDRGVSPSSTLTTRTTLMVFFILFIEHGSCPLWVKDANQ